MSLKLSAVTELAALSLIWGMLTMINKELIRAKCEFWQLLWLFSVWYMRMHADQNRAGCINAAGQKLKHIRLLISLCVHNLSASD